MELSKGDTTTPAALAKVITVGNNRRYVARKTRGRPQELPDDVHGTFAVRKGGVLLHDRSNDPIALVCANDDYGVAWRGTGFIITAGLDKQGRTYFMYGLSDWTARALEIEALGYMAQHEVAASVIKQARPLYEKRFPPPQIN